MRKFICSCKCRPQYVEISFHSALCHLHLSVIWLTMAFWEKELHKQRNTLPAPCDICDLLLACWEQGLKWTETYINDSLSNCFFLVQISRGFRVRSPWRLLSGLHSNEYGEVLWWRPLQQIPLWFSISVLQRLEQGNDILCRLCIMRSLWWCQYVHILYSPLHCVHHCWCSGHIFRSTFLLSQSQIVNFMTSCPELYFLLRACFTSFFSSHNSLLSHGHIVNLTSLSISFALSGASSELNQNDACFRCLWSLTKHQPKLYLSTSWSHVGFGCSVLGRECLFG